jgi:hypothetical protein
MPEGLIMQKRDRVTVALISEFLSTLKEELEAQKIKPSDAALAAIRLGRVLFSDIRLAPITRELLGYSKEEADIELELIDLTREDGTGAIAKCVARHRLVNGFRLPLFVTLHQAQMKLKPEVKREQTFCGLSATEIELLLEESIETKSPYTVLDYRNEQNGAFLCRVSDLKVMYEGMVGLISALIELLLTELDAESVERGATKELEMGK